MNEERSVFSVSATPACTSPPGWFLTTSSMLPEVKYFIRSMKIDDARTLVEEVLQIHDPVAVVRHLENFRTKTIS